jgi:hypothetical protein
MVDDINYAMSIRTYKTEAWYRGESQPEPSIFIVGRSRIGAIPGLVIATRALRNWRSGQYLVRSSETENKSDDCTERAVGQARAWILQGQARHDMP